MRKKIALMLLDSMQAPLKILGGNSDFEISDAKNA